MATFAPAQLVKGAVRQPLPYGLFAVLNFDTPMQPYWQAGGVTWDVAVTGDVNLVGHPTGAGEAEGVLPGSPSMGVPKNFDMAPAIDKALPFSVYGQFKVSPIAYSQEEAEFKALESLVAKEQTKVEHALWTGEADNTPFLDDPDSTVAITGTSPIEAIANLEDHIASSYGSLGVIHMARSVALKLLSSGNHCLETKGSLLQTKLGTPVVAGAGYAKDEIKASPAMFGLRSEVFYSSQPGSPNMDPKNNDLYAIAERTYLIGYDSTGVGSVTLT